MTVIHARRYRRTLEMLAVRAARSGAGRIAAWTFDDGGSRRAAEARLAALGIDARIRSAYKPLVHFFLEDVETAGLEAVHIAYPVHPAAADNRFLLEAYPVDALIGPATLSFSAGSSASLTYDVTLRYRDGRTVTDGVFAPNRRHRDHLGEWLLSPTGWLIVDDEGRRMATDYERLFWDAMTALGTRDWGTREPYFEELCIDVALPSSDQPLPLGQEAISLTEALHEDLYFSLLELFQRRAGLPLGDRGLRPGQIVPNVRSEPAGPSIRIALRPHDRADATGPKRSLETAEAPLAAADVDRELAKIGGTTLEGRSVAGRTLLARHRSGSDRGVLITAAQHANETTGIVGALRAARRLDRRRSAHFALVPVANPDGYALHHRLRAGNPGHMHHAARYTALGNDLQDQRPSDRYERALRRAASDAAGAQLHINLHGYPAHEWTRPLTGYGPRGFPLWALPKGYFLILRHHAGWHDAARAVLEAVTLRLSGHADLVAFNVEQIGRYERYAGPLAFERVNGFPVTIAQDARSSIPVTMITEYPDETISGAAFVAGHTAQMEATLAAYDAWQSLAGAVS